MTSQPPQSDPLAGFGANEWLVQEIYQNYLENPDSVDPVWREFLADYVPGVGNGGPTAAATTTPTAPPKAAAPPAPEPAASKPAARPAAPATAAGERRPLRGAASRVVANMEASLTVPTATSVRSSPPSCSSTTASSSTTTCGAVAAARCRSRT